MSTMSSTTNLSGLERLFSSVESAWWHASRKRTAVADVSGGRVLLGERLEPCPANRRTFLDVILERWMERCWFRGEGTLEII